MAANLNGNVLAKRRLHALCCTVLLILSLPVMAAPATASCDPSKSQNDQALGLLAQNKLDDAEGLVDAILRKDPANFQANYTKGRILVTRSGLDKPGQLDKNLNRPIFENGMSVLVNASHLLDKVDGKCLKANGWASIYNTIGTDYFNAQNPEEAGKYLKLAADKWDMLQPGTQQLLLKNLDTLTDELYARKKYYDAVSFLYIVAKLGKGATANNSIAFIEAKQTIEYEQSIPAIAAHTDATDASK